MRRLVEGLAASGLIGLAAAVLAGFLGAFHGAGDSFAVFRPQAAILLLVASAAVWALGLRRLALAGAVLAGVAGLTVAPHLVQGAQASGQSIVLYQKNLRFRLEDPVLITADIRASAADIVTLQEVNSRTRPVLDSLADLYPTRVTCPFGGVGGVAILSRWPARPSTKDCLGVNGVASVILDAPSGPLHIVSAHLSWPWPHQQPVQVETVLPELERIDTPTILAGDFNMVRWSHTLRAFAQASDTAPAGPSRITLPGRVIWPGLPIDHVLTPGGAGTTEIRPLLGSDHYGILARIPETALAPHATRP